MKPQSPDRRQKIENLANDALDFMLAHGYAQVTVDDIARHIGISRATFFRIFNSKEEAAMTALTGARDQFAISLQAANPSPDKPIFPALRAAFDHVAKQTEMHGERMRARIRLLQTIPSVGQELRQLRAPTVQTLVDCLEAAGFPPVQARLYAHVAQATYEVALTHWVQYPEKDLASTLDELFAALSRTQ